MLVRLQNTNNTTFLNITTDDNGSYTFMLEPKMTAGAAMRKQAADCRKKAERLLKKASLLEQAEQLI